MEMHQLRYFLAVAQSGNFSRAARACHVSQPSLSQQIRKLEEEFGQSLFDRQPQGASLTPAGWLLLPYARSILGQSAEVQRRMEEVGGEARGRLVVGVLPTIAPYFLPELLSGFTARWPEVELVVEEEITPRLLEAVEQGRMELALLSLPVANDALEATPLFSEPLLFVAPEGHPLLRQAGVKMAELSREVFILMQEGHCLSDQALEFCQRRGAFAPKVSCRSAQIGTLLELVRIGLGVSLIPEMAATPSSGLAYRPLLPVAPRREIGFVHHRKRFQPLAAKVFIRWVSEAVKLSGREEKKVLPSPALNRS